MKVDRVILVTNNNPLYYEFWNKLSYTYKEKFGINPTLIFFGEEKEIESLNLSKEYGDIIVEKKVPNVLDWQYTWALFYFTKFYPDETCAVMGIDQIPLGTYFFKDCIKDITDEKYVMLIDNQYTLESKHKYKWDEGGFSPSAYHIAKGKTFNEFFNFEDSFEKEILKVNNLNIKTMWGDKWGLDEAYSCNVLQNYPNRNRIAALSKARDFLSRRIDCYRNIEVRYDINLLKNNFFIECHSCRPYHNHKNYIDNLFDNIPKYI